MQTMQTKASRQRSAQPEQRAVQAQPGRAAQRRTDPLGSAATLLSLQRSHGNRYVQRLLDAAVLQRSCGCGSCASCGSKQPARDLRSEPGGVYRCSAEEASPSSVPPVVHEVLRSAGQPLDASTRAFMEPRFGRDLQHVRIHDDAKASVSAKAVSALAYTVGPNVVFAEGQYRPTSQEGRRLLAHELAHTVQQSGASPGLVSGISQPGDASEREADSVADHVMRMPAPGAPAIDEMPGAGLQRMCGHCAEEDKDKGAPGAPEAEEQVGAGVDADMPALRPPGQAQAEEEEPHSPIVRAPDLIRRAQAGGLFTAGTSPATPTAAGIAVQPRAGAAGVLQRWAVGGAADKATNTIVCDGSGGIRVQAGTANDPGSFACVGDCILKHEGSHRTDALASNAEVCKGSADGTQVTFSSVDEQKASEIKASQVEIDCLNVKLASATATCKPSVEQRIIQITAYRDSFK
jgi:hypothetical protein